MRAACKLCMHMIRLDTCNISHIEFRARKINPPCCMQAHPHWISCKKNKSTTEHASPQTNCTKKINAKQPHCIVRPNMRKKRPQRQLIFLQAMDLEFAARTIYSQGGAAQVVACLYGPTYRLIHIHGPQLVDRTLSGQ